MTTPWIISVAIAEQIESTLADHKAGVSLWIVARRTQGERETVFFDI